MPQKLIKSATLALMLSLGAFSAPPAQALEGSLPLNEVRTFVDILDRIKKAYVEEVDDKTLLENAIKGMLSELDPHSAYLDPKAFDDLQINTTGEFGGLGIEVGMENNFIKVITPIDDTPAQRAGVKSGDLIIKLDDDQVNGMTLEQAVGKMRGKPGTTIDLTIAREGEAQPIVITVKRAVIQVKSVRSKLLEPQYGYIRLSQFQVNTGEELAAQLKKLHTEESPLKGFVLDMRNNPGGVLQSAVSVSDAFLEEGLVTYTQGRLPNSELRFNASEGDLINGIPMVVLINGGSASASEIVAGALQDHGRAVIMGTASFGKGSVQTVLPLHNERALKLTTARYYTPNGRSIQATGIVPDIIVESAKITRVNSASDQFREADLRGHLLNQFSEDERKGDNGDKKPPTLAEEDYQLFHALSLLKGLSVVSKL